jgi:hypothetical protein
MIKGQSLLCHLLDIGHGTELGSVVLEVMNRIILGNEENNVRTLGPKWGSNDKEKDK